MTKRPRVVVCGWYGASNIGDELLLGVVHAWVRELGGELTIVSLNPEHTARTYATAAVDFLNLGDIARALADSDLFVMGGGGIFQDHHTFNIDALYDPVAADIAQYARPFYLACQFGVRTLILAHGVGPLSSSQSRQVVRDVFSLADAVSLRDEQSAVLLKSIGVERELLVAADPGWFAAGQVLPLAEDAPSVADKGGKKRLALIIREWWKDAGWEDKLIDAVNRQLPDGWCCQWFAFQHALDESRASSDRPFLERLSTALDPRIDSDIVVCSDVAKTVADIGCCDAVVSMRLHGSILSLALDKPCAFLEYDDKMTQAHNMAQIPPELRIELAAPVEAYQALLARLFGGEPAWRIARPVLASLQASSLEHRRLLTESMAHAAGAARAAWASQDFDWLGAWLQSLIWQRRTLQRTNDRAHELLHYRDFQLQERDRQCNELQSQAEQAAALLQEQADIARERQSSIEALQIESDSQKAYINEKEIYIAKLIQEIEHCNTGLGKLMFRKFKTLAQQSKHAIDLLQNGGPRALLSALRRRQQIRQAQWQQDQALTSLAPVIVASPLPVLGDRLEEVARLRAEEVVILACRPFAWLGGHHRAAQLAQAALSAGHRVVYVCSDPLDAARTPPGMLQLSLEGLAVGELFARLSQRAVILSFLVDSAVLPLMQYARARGLRACLDAGVGDSDSQALDSPLFRQLAALADFVCVASASVAQRLQDAGCSVLHMPAAASHTCFDAYRQYAQPAQLQGDSRTKALVLAPGGETLIDWDYLVHSAELNPRIAFFLLGLANPLVTLPGNVVVLPLDCLEQANAFIAHVDFVLAPLTPAALSADAALQGILAGAFLNKPVLSSQPVILEHLHGLLHLPVPECLGDLAERLGGSRANDLFVATHSWLSRLERLVPSAPRGDVSVVILIHNNARIIARCLETLLQHCGAFIREVIVVDNASTDGGAELVERQFQQVKLVRNPENGCSSGRNLGVEHATGKYLAFFDSDQWFTGGSGFAEALAILENHAGVGVIGWNAGWFDASRTDLGGMIADYCPNRAMNAQAIRRGYRSDIGFLGTSGLFMRRATFDAIEGFDTFYDPTCFEDTDLCFQIRAMGMDVSFRDLSGIRHQPHQTTGADSGSNKYRQLFLRNAKYFKEKWHAHPHFFIDYTV